MRYLIIDNKESPFNCPSLFLTNTITEHEKQTSDIGDLIIFDTVNQKEYDGNDTWIDINTWNRS